MADELHSRSLGKELIADIDSVVTDAIPVQVWTALPNGDLDFVSDRVAEYFGAPRESLLGTGWAKHVHPEDVPEAFARWTRCLATGESYEVQFRLQRYDGAWLWHIGRARARRAPDGAIVKWYGSNTDVDEGVRARDALVKQSEMERHLTAIVSHDLRNPLTAVVTSAALLLRDGKLDARQGKAIARITSSAERGLRLIDDLLDFSRVRATGSLPVKPQWTNLETLVRHAVDEIHLIHADRELTLTHDGPAEAFLDEDRIAQLVGNLVSNAFEHGAANGVVRVNVRVDAMEAILEVHNTGTPISAADLPRLFQPFHRSERGAGLGLYIAKAIADGHGGTMRVASTEHDGTTFTLVLPMSPAR